MADHQWHSEDYVNRWVQRDAERMDKRRPGLRRAAELVGVEASAAVAIVDLGAGYGALSEEVLRTYPRATVVVHDFSEPMRGRARARLAWAGGRVRFAAGDLKRPGWDDDLTGDFDAVVSAIAIHNLDDGQRIAALYGEILQILRPGGCFVNLDLFTGPEQGRSALGTGAAVSGNGHGLPALDVAVTTRALPSVSEHLGWLAGAGFGDTGCAWTEAPQAIVVGTRPT